MVFAWQEPDVLAALSKEGFGRELAEQVACKLKQQLEAGKGYDKELYHLPQIIHRDYCGYCVFATKSKGWGYGEIGCDGYPPELPGLRQWDTKEEFVEWLAEQSDYTMAFMGMCDPKDWPQEDMFAVNNQTITRSKLTDSLDEE
ncbi:unnamed protein product [Effrenium voratum]|uniref:Uncharacterized protein n=1 Tax=Effrenium voratum TaxID=2562239 RepID=A0AA36NMQ3_9DINO|nr:unnamed protein product [Effrenium voratum]